MITFHSQRKPALRLELRREWNFIACRDPISRGRRDENK